MCVCMCRVLYRILSFRRGGSPKFGVESVQRITTREAWGHAPRFFLNFRCSEIYSEAFWRY